MKHSLVISVCLVGSLLGLSGCSEEIANADNNKVANVQENSKKAVEQTKPKEVPKPVVVNVSDPNTHQILKSFVPKDMGYGTDDTNYKLQIENWAKAEARGTDTTAGYDQRMLPDRIGADGQIIKGRPMTILDESALTNEIIQASAKGGNVNLPLSVTPSGYNMDELSHLGEVVVASYTTRFSNSDAGRTRNVELSAAAINNVIVGTQDIFSYNTTLGPSDQAHGYQPAKEAVDGKLVDRIGGGICQTSSTLYNAVDQLGVTYVEKHHHSVHVGYVPPGRDATVSYGGPDFRFQNTTGVPLLVRAIADKARGTLTVEVRTSQSMQGLLKK